MSKYRLSYLDYGGFKDIKLDKLECLSEKLVTDVEVIDEFTTNFNSLEELLIYLKNSNLIPNDINKLYITIDKKVENNIINKKIYNGDKLLFKNDKKYLNLSYIYKWILYNKNNSKFICGIADNYIEKYKNAYNRITGSSYILNIFYTMKALILNKSIDRNVDDLKQFNDCITEFIDFEFYKIDKDKFIKDKKIIKKKDKFGNTIKNYRNIHDFIILIKELDKELDKYVINNNESNLNIFDNNIEVDEEEFLTYEDYIRMDIEEPDYFESFKDGIDYIVPITKSDLEDIKNDRIKKLIL